MIMHYRIHKVHTVRYGSELPDSTPARLAIQLLSECGSYHKNLEGTQMEVSFEDLQDLISRQKEGEVKDFLQTIYESADKNNSFAFIDFC